MKIDQQIYDFHKWYDSVEEPTRLLLLLALVALVQTFVAFGGPVVVTVVVLAGYLFPLYTRIWYLSRGNKSRPL